MTPFQEDQMTIHKLRVENERLQAENKRLKEINEAQAKQLGEAYEDAAEDAARLRTALRPFALRNARLEKEYPDRPDSQCVFFDLTHGDFRKAQAAFQQKPSLDPTSKAHERVGDPTYFGEGER